MTQLKKMGRHQPIGSPEWGGQRLQFSQESPKGFGKRLDLPREKETQGQNRTNMFRSRSPTPPCHVARQNPGEKRGQKHLEIHHSFFDSLGILLPKQADNCKARIWPILVREKGPLKEVLIHSKNQILPSFPIGIRLVREGEEDQSSQPTMEKLISTWWLAWRKMSSSTNYH